jgi:peptide/nickel transport system substrate-binding protein
MSDRIDRRSFLARGAVAGVGLAAVGTTGGLLAACSSSSGSSSTTPGTSGHPDGISTATPKAGGALVFGTEAEEQGFDPTTATFDNTGIMYARTVFDPLAILAANGSVQPYLAQSITANADYTVWTVTMRPNLLFHDNTPCDAAAVAYNFNAQKNSLLTGQSLTTIDTITVTSPLVVTVTMKSPWVPFDYYLAGGIGGQIAFIAAPSMLKNPQGTTHPVGTGPFVFQEWHVNDHFTATKNPHYWRSGYPYLDSITYKPILDGNQLLNSLKAGSVDIIHSSLSVVTAGLRGDTSLAYIDDTVHVAGEPDMNCMMLNLAKPPFDNPKARQAAAMAINSEQYTKVINQGINPTSNGPFIQSSPYYVADNGYPEANPARARQLVQQVAQETGKAMALTLQHTPDASTVLIAEFLQQQLQVVGMTVTLDPILQNQQINNALLGTFDATVWRQFGAIDPDLNYIFWSPTTINPGFSINMARNNDPALEAALLKGRQSSVQADRDAAYQEMNKLMGADIPYAWTARAVWSCGAQPSVQNFNNPTTPSGQPAFGFVTGAIWPTQIWLGS